MARRDENFATAVACMFSPPIVSYALSVASQRDLNTRLRWEKEVAAAFKACCSALWLEEDEAAWPAAREHLRDLLDRAPKAKKNAAFLDVLARAHDKTGGEPNFFHQLCVYGARGGEEREDEVVLCAEDGNVDECVRREVERVPLLLRVVRRGEDVERVRQFGPVILQTGGSPYYLFAVVVRPPDSPTYLLATNDGDLDWQKVPLFSLKESGVEGAEGLPWSSEEVVLCAQQLFYKPLLSPQLRELSEPQERGCGDEEGGLVEERAVG